MSKKKQNILGKIVQKDFNNELEKVIETKDFDEEVKNLLLGILYKVDVSYKDYTNVKRDVETKNEYIQKIINTIQNNCDTIKIEKANNEHASELGERTFLVDKENKKIICYPVERKLLYSIAKIGKQENILNNKYFILNKTISNIINIGNNINTVEPLRDFNGWSWTTITREIENVSYNLIYQNLKILVGDKFLNSWITNKEYIIDYYEEFKNELSERFGTKLKEKIILVLEQLSILLEIEINPLYENELKDLWKETKENLLKFQNNQEFVEKLTEEKKNINKEINKLEKILNNKEFLAKEYSKINKNPSPYEKIFSIKVLEKKIKAKRQDLLEQLEERNELLNPKKFIIEKNKLEKRAELLSVAKKQDKQYEKEKRLEELQILFLQCFLMLINRAETKEEIINLIYLFRYYNLLPFNEKININQNNELQEDLKEVKEKLLIKAIEFKIIIEPSQNMKENIELLHFLFETRIILMEDIYIALIKEKDKFYIEFSEDNENSYEEKYEIDSIKKENLNIKLNKKNKIFI